MTYAREQDVEALVAVVRTLSNSVSDLAQASIALSRRVTELENQLRTANLKAK